MPPRKIPAKRARQDEGTSSSAPARQVFDRQKFNSLKNQIWYNGTSNKDLLVEKTVSDWIEGEYHISEKFQTLGWSPILTLKGAYYPELVRQFYANMKKPGITDCSTSPINSVVNGKEIVISVGAINKLLGLTCTGQTLYVHHSDVSLEGNWEVNQAAGRFRVLSSTTKNGKRSMKAKTLDISPRLVAYLLNFNVQSRKAKNILRVSDLYIMDKMFFGLGSNIQGIPLAPTIIAAMRDMFVRRDGVWINPFRVDEQELDDSDEEWVESEEEEEENQVIAPAAANAEELSDRELLMNLIASVNALGVKVDHMQGTLDQLVANQQQQPPSP
ncbi:hypothetical protein CCACVL1_28954 [Corchorus capsularis]|uniref:Putative plant transposon protein domain-containing protein n=2 Tax=Corchorus capsularis TaxID=210143 RepID=A0A1R3G4N1_COCAP|nr:hypothetical protein CCACVL1_28954 [Corchorus capsularis]